MAKRTEIEKALDELIADEAGMKFQALAVVLAKKKWPRLVASERKWDLGLDAYAKGDLEANGQGLGLISSLTPTYNKIASDARKVKKNFSDVRVLIFATATGVTNHEKRKWEEDTRKDFDLQLIVLSREELVTSLMDPANAAICSSQLGISVELQAELILLLQRARDATTDVVATWERRPRLAGRPLIELDAERIEEANDAHVSVTLESLQNSLGEGRRIILEAPAGRGKTTTLVQLARRIVGMAGLPFLIDLPAWARSGKEILQFISERPQFASRGLDPGALSSLLPGEQFLFLLNGWNEVSEAMQESAVQALRDLELNYPAAGILVATRTHHITPPLPGAFRARLLPLRRNQRDHYLNLALGESGNALRVKLNSNRTIDDLTRTPLILAEVTELFRRGNVIPTTKMGILGAVVHALEEEHHSSLQQAPLGGHGIKYLGAISMAMTAKGETEIEEEDARAVVSSVSTALQATGQIAAQPEQGVVLHALSNHHVLERLDLDGIAFRFEHQQFQEFFAALELKRLLLSEVRGNDGKQERLFLSTYVNEPRWGESIYMLAEDIGSVAAASGDEKEITEVGARLVRMALFCDPVFSAELARACGPKIWCEVRKEVGARLRELYAQDNGNYKQGALAAMLATGFDDFKDILVPLLTDAKEQVRLATYHTGTRVLPSSLGPNWRELVAGWQEDARLNFVLRLADNPWFADIVESVALADPSTTIRWRVAHALSWYGFTDKVEKLLGTLDDASWRDALLTFRPEQLPLYFRPRAVEVYEKLYAETEGAVERLKILPVIESFGGTNMVDRMKQELQRLDLKQLKPEDERIMRWALDELRKADSIWVSEWLAGKVLDKSTWFGKWQGLIHTMPKEERESLFGRLSHEALEDGDKEQAIALLAAAADNDLAARAFARACDLRRPLASFREDLPKWKVFGQLERLLKAMSPEVVVAAVVEKLDGPAEPTELGVLAAALATFNPIGSDVRTSLSEDMRQKLRAYLKRGVQLAADPHGVRAETRANLAALLAQVGEPDDLADIRQLVEADGIRFREMQEARSRGNRSHEEMGYHYHFIDAVAKVDPAAADHALLELLGKPEYERILAERLPQRAKRSEPQVSFGSPRLEFARIWDARAGKEDHFFIEERRSLYADALRDTIGKIRGEREQATDKRTFDYRLIILAPALAALDGKRSARSVLDILQLPGSWDGWSRVSALENLLVAGVRLSLDDVLKSLDSPLQELKSRFYDSNQNAWLMERCLSVLAFVDPPSPGIAKIREILAGLHFPQHELRTVAAALGASRCEDAIDSLMELAGADGKGAEIIGEPWIKAIATLGGKRAKDVLLSFVDPSQKVFSTDFVPDHQYGDLPALVLSEMADKEPEFKRELLELANRDLPPTKQTLLAKVFARFQNEDDFVAGLSVLRDGASGVPYELLRAIEDRFLEHRPYGAASNAYTLAPQGSNAVRKRLLDMAMTDPLRKRSAIALLGQIEEWRLEYGRPDDELRHPALDSGVHWPPVLA